MTNEEAEKLELGLYRIHWVEGGSSLAAVGKDSSKRWFVPCNWQADTLSYEWYIIKRVDLLFSVADDRDTKFNEAENQIGKENAQFQAMSVFLAQETNKILDKLEEIKPENPREILNTFVSHIDQKFSAQPNYSGRFDKLDPQITAILDALIRLSEDARLEQDTDIDTVDKKISNMNCRIEKLEHIKQPSRPVNTPKITDDEMKILNQAVQIKLKYNLAWNTMWHG